jgi:hypothetical protein
MNVKERVEWTKALRACFPGLQTDNMTSAAEAIPTPGRWEVSVRGGALNAAGLRFFGEGDYAAFRKEAAKAFVLGNSGPDSPADGFPWLIASWDLATGQWASVRLTGLEKGGKQVFAWEFSQTAKIPKKRLLKPAPFKPGAFGDMALDKALADFAKLCPVSTLSLEEPGWSLKLAAPPRWPMFARCDISAAFTPLSSQLALFLLDRRVTELSFDGEALWAHCTG